MLKDEISESLLRLKAAKFGHSIEEIAPQYNNSFYLPDKSAYEPKVNIEVPRSTRNFSQHHSFNGLGSGGHDRSLFMG
jgi:hypothetical protein